MALTESQLNASINTNLKIGLSGEANKVSKTDLQTLFGDYTGLLYENGNLLLLPESGTVGYFVRWTATGAEWVDIQSLTFPAAAHTHALADIVGLLTDGKISTNLIPDIAINTVVQSSENSLANYISNEWTDGAIQVGDMVQITVPGSPATVELWLLSTNNGSVSGDYVKVDQTTVSWANVTGKPAEIDNLAIRHASERHTQNTNVTLTLTSNYHQFIDSIDANIDVILPGSSNGYGYFIKNDGSGGNTLNIGPGLVDLRDGEFCTVYYENGGYHVQKTQTELNDLIGSGFIDPNYNTIAEIAAYLVRNVATGNSNVSADTTLSATTSPYQFINASQAVTLTLPSSANIFGFHIRNISNFTVTINNTGGGELCQLENGDYAFFKFHSSTWYMLYSEIAANAPSASVPTNTYNTFSALFASEFFTVNQVVYGAQSAQIPVPTGNLSAGKETIITNYTYAANSFDLLQADADSRPLPSLTVGREYTLTFGTDGFEYFLKAYTSNQSESGGIQEVGQQTMPAASEIFKSHIRVTPSGSNITGDIPAPTVPTDSILGAEFSVLNIVASATTFSNIESFFKDSRHKPELITGREYNISVHVHQVSPLILKPSAELLPQSITADSVAISTDSFESLASNGHIQNERVNLSVVNYSGVNSEGDHTLELFTASSTGVIDVDNDTPVLTAKMSTNPRYPIGAANGFCVARITLFDDQGNQGVQLVSPELTMRIVTHIYLDGTAISSGGFLVISGGEGFESAGFWDTNTPTYSVQSGSIGGETRLYQRIEKHPSAPTSASIRMTLAGQGNFPVYFDAWTRNPDDSDVKHHVTGGNADINSGSNIDIFINQEANFVRHQEVYDDADYTGNHYFVGYQGITTLWEIAVNNFVVLAA